MKHLDNYWVICSITALFSTASCPCPEAIFYLPLARRQGIICRTAKFNHLIHQSTEQTSQTNRATGWLLCCMVLLNVTLFSICASKNCSWQAHCRSAKQNALSKIVPADVSIHLRTKCAFPSRLL